MYCLHTFFGLKRLYVTTHLGWLLMGGFLPAQGLWAGQPAVQAGSRPLQMASQVAAVHVHSRLGLAVLQRVGTAHWDAVQSMPIGRLSAADAAAARQLLSLRVLRLDGPARGPAVAPLHTGLHFWAGQGARWGCLLFLQQARWPFLLCNCSDLECSAPGKLKMMQSMS